MKIVEITSLAMRFPASCWTYDDLKPYLTGDLIKRGFGINESEYCYYILDVGSHLNIDQMFADGIVSEVVGKDSWGETRHLSDIDAMKRRNW